MGKNIEWLKKETEKLYKHDEAYLNPDDIVVENYQTVTSILELIDQLDEPEQVVIPQFVADFIKERTEDENGDKPESNTVYNFISNCHHDFQLGYYKGVSKWFHISLDNQKKLESAWLYGYTIEQPKLLTVIVKDYDKTIMSKQLPENEVMKLMEGLE